MPDTLFSALVGENEEETLEEMLKRLLLRQDRRDEALLMALSRMGSSRSRTFPIVMGG